MEAKVDQMGLLDSDYRRVGISAMECTEDTVERLRVPFQRLRGFTAEPQIIQAGHHDIDAGRRRGILNEKRCGCGAKAATDSAVFWLETQSACRTLDEAVRRRRGAVAGDPGMSVRNHPQHCDTILPQNSGTRPDIFIY